MLKELVHVRQIEGEGFRRWFRDADFDLIVFFHEKDGEITGFQLCYRLSRKEERIFSWYRACGSSHTKVDTGETEPLEYKKSPILVADGVFEADVVLEKFLAAAILIPRHITEEVKTRIQCSVDGC